MTTKTDLEFSYEPADFFEALLSLSLPHGELTLENGKAVCTLRSPVDPVPDALREELFETASGAFKLRQLQIGRTFKLLQPTIIQYRADGTRGRVMRASGEEVLCMTGKLDAVHTDATGKVTYDSRAERLKEDAKFITALLPKMADGTMRAMVDSYCRALDDPANELVHLYEVLDGTRKYFGDERTARAKLEVSRNEWSDLGRLSNHEPLNQGRHRGKHAPNLRDATVEEIEHARRIARKIIEALAAAI